jgi:hypothetical protein
MGASVRDAFGVEQTEIDALATLRPRVLDDIVRAAIKPYFDESLASRVSHAESDWREAAQDALEQQINGDVMDAIRERAASQLAELEASIETGNSGWLQRALSAYLRSSSLNL